MRFDEVVGYTYRADIYCPDCVVVQLVEEAKAPEGSTERSAEIVIDELAESRSIDRDDELSFDSDSFPKVILAVDEDGSVCGRCGRRLDALVIDITEQATIDLAEERSDAGT